MMYNFKVKNVLVFPEENQWYISNGDETYLYPDLTTGKWIEDKKGYYRTKEDAQNQLDLYLSSYSKPTVEYNKNTGFYIHRYDSNQSSLYLHRNKTWNTYCGTPNFFNTREEAYKFLNTSTTKESIQDIRDSVNELLKKLKILEESL